MLKFQNEFHFRHVKFYYSKKQNKNIHETPLLKEAGRWQVDRALTIQASGRLLMELLFCRIQYEL